MASVITLARNACGLSAIAAAIALVLVSGCESGGRWAHLAELEEGDIPTLVKGMSIDEARAALHPATSRRYELAAKISGGRRLTDREAVDFEEEPSLRHEFALREDGARVDCFSARIIVGRPFYLVFADGRLVRVIESPPREYRTMQGEHGPVGVPVAQAPSIAWDGTPLTRDDMVRIIRERAELTLESDKHTEGSILVLLAPLVWLDDARTDNAAHRRDMYRCLDRMDTSRIGLGMTRYELERIFGTPRDVVGVRLETMRVIWEAGGPCNVRFAAEFVGGELSAVYGGDFFDPDWLGTGVAAR